MFGLEETLTAFDVHLSEKTYLPEFSLNLTQKFLHLCIISEKVHIYSSDHEKILKNSLGFGLNVEKEYKA
jgi:hypothetical protein